MSVSFVPSKDGGDDEFHDANEVFADAEVEFCIERNGNTVNMFLLLEGDDVSVKEEDGEWTKVPAELFEESLGFVMEKTAEMGDTMLPSAVGPDGHVNFGAFDLSKAVDLGLAGGLAMGLWTPEFMKVASGVSKTHAFGRYGLDLCKVALSSFRAVATGNVCETAINVAVLYGALGAAYSLRGTWPVNSVVETVFGFEKRTLNLEARTKLVSDNCGATAQADLIDGARTLNASKVASGLYQGALNALKNRAGASTCPMDNMALDHAVQQNAKFVARIQAGARTFLTQSPRFTRVLEDGFRFTRYGTDAYRSVRGWICESLGAKDRGLTRDQLMDLRYERAQRDDARADDKADRRRSRRKKA
jgi:hypothetical protein